MGPGVGPAPSSLPTEEKPTSLTILPRRFYRRNAARATQAVWESNAIKLDLGAGAISPEGFTPLGNVNGTSIFPLPYADGSVDVIRASHVLEHFPHRQIVGRHQAEWVRALKPGGVLQIAVPDFKVIAERYLAGEQRADRGLPDGRSDR